MLSQAKVFVLPAPASSHQLHRKPIRSSHVVKNHGLAAATAPILDAENKRRGTKRVSIDGQIGKVEFSPPRNTEIKQNELKTSHK